MKIYVNNLGITCVEPDEGYLLKKGDMICKKAYLGINDRAELYEQIVDENYVYKEEDEKEEVTETSSLDFIKVELIKLSKSKLATYLEEHPLFSKAKYKEGRYYNVDSDHQSRIASQLLLYQGNISLGLEYQLTWNDTGSVCENWTFEELFKLSNEINAYIKPIIKKQQEIEVDIRNTETKEELDKIEIKY